MNRRNFLGMTAFAHLLKADGLAGIPHFPPKVKRVILLHQSGGPSQIDLFDYKPTLSQY
jgi:hypothetical protein